MFDLLQRTLKINHILVKIDNKEMLVHKHISREFQDELDEIMTLLRLLDYDFEVFYEKYKKSGDIDLLFENGNYRYHISFALNKRGYLKYCWIMVTLIGGNPEGDVVEDYYNSTKNKTHLIPIKKLKERIIRA